MFEQSNFAPQYFGVQQEERKEKIFVLDGYKNGITAFIVSENRYIQPRNGRQNYFTNYKILESALISGGYEKLDYEIRFILAAPKGGTYEFGIEDTYFNSVKGGWEALMADESGTYTFDALIKPKYVESITSIGYIETARSSSKLVIEKKIKNFKELAKKFREDKFNEIFDIVSNAAGLMTTYPKYDVYRSTDSTIDTLILCIRGTSGRIVITSNQNIIEYNEKKRKANGLRCLPFDKNKDKFGTLYVYTTIDVNENEYVKDRLYHTIVNLMNICRDVYPTSLTRYERVEFSGYILKEED